VSKSAALVIITRLVDAQAPAALVKQDSISLAFYVHKSGGARLLVPATIVAITPPVLAELSEACEMASKISRARAIDYSRGNEPSPTSTPICSTPERLYHPIHRRVLGSASQTRSSPKRLSIPTTMVGTPIMTPKADGAE
jgi:hypothetical protein